MDFYAIAVGDGDGFLGHCHSSTADSHCRLYKSRSIICLAEMDFEGFAVFGEHAEVLLGDAFADGILLTGIDQGDAGAFEAGTTEAATVDALGLTHNVVDGD